MEEVYRNFNHSRAKAIKEHCLECSGFVRSERQNCPAKGCALWAFRNGYEVNADNQRIAKREWNGKGFGREDNRDLDENELDNSDDFEAENSLALSEE